MALRVGAVSYLNTKPLIYRLEEHLPGAELRLDLPSRLADQLRHGELDVALIPSVEYFRAEADGRAIVSDACIACRGPVWSVQLLFRTAPGRVATLALDEGSRTSAALARILLKRRCGIEPRTLPLPIGTAAESVDADALLVIGDRALRGWGDEFIEVWDLGDQWCRATELPFVFAMWVARDNQLDPHIARGLQAARDDGLANAEEIAAAVAGDYGLTFAECLDYFRKFLHFRLGPAERRGLTLFHQDCIDQGLVPPRTATAGA
jgi:chorismate dehydratase